MFQNPSTLWIEILVIVLIVAFLSFLIGKYIYRKKKGMPTGECACCASSKKGNNLVKQYNKTYHKDCCCSKER